VFKFDNSARSGSCSSGKRVGKRCLKLGRFVAGRRFHRGDGMMTAIRHSEWGDGRE